MSGVEKIAKLIKKGNTEKLGELLQDLSFDINQLDPKSGKTLLQLSMEAGEKQAFQIIIKTKGIRIQTVSTSGQTALQTAILMNSADFIDQILRNKTSSNILKGDLGHSALQFAIKNKSSPQIISKLLYHGFDVNQQIQKYGSLLNMAIAYSQFQNFATLLKNPKTDIKVLDEDQNTSLLLAVKQKKGQYVREILNQIKSRSSVDSSFKEMQIQFYLNACDKEGNTALHIAAIKDYQTILDILLKQGTALGLDRQAKNKQGKTYQEIVTQRAQERQKQKARQEYQQKKRIEQRKIKNKQKQEEKIRLANQQQLQRAAQKKRKKQQQILEAQRLEMKIEMEKKRKIWIAGISLVVILGVMYLLFLSAVKPKSSDSF